MVSMTNRCPKGTTTSNNRRGAQVLRKVQAGEERKEADTKAAATPRAKCSVQSPEAQSRHAAAAGQEACRHHIRNESGVHALPPL